jgi:inorganic pyrophosphatase
MAKKKNKSREEGDAVVDIVIETPQGCRNKFSYKEKQGQFRLTKVLPQGMVFPYDFGFVPGTHAEDGDPLDVLVLMEEPAFPGCVVESALIGVIEAEEEKDGEKYRNDRVLAVATSSELYAEVRDISDLNDSVVHQIEKFFVNYQRVAGVGYEVLGIKGREAAVRAVRKSREKKAA